VASSWVFILHFDFVVQNTGCCSWCGSFQEETPTLLHKLTPGSLADVWFEFQDTCFRANLQISGNALFYDMTVQFFRKWDRPYVYPVIKRATRN